MKRPPLHPRCLLLLHVRTFLHIHIFLHIHTLCLSTWIKKKGKKRCRFIIYGTFSFFFFCICKKKYTTWMQRRTRPKESMCMSVRVCLCVCVCACVRGMRTCARVHVDSRHPKKKNTTWMKRRRGQRETVCMFVCVHVDEVIHEHEGSKRTLIERRR